MILNFHPLPQNTDDVAAAIADAVLEVCGDFTVRDFIPLLSRCGGLEVTTYISRDHRLAIKSAKITLSGIKDESACEGFTCKVPVTEGIIRSRTAVRTGLEAHLINTSAGQYMEKWGRPFVDIDETEIARIIDKDVSRYSWAKHCHQWNTALCCELARQELDQRTSESAHEKLKAVLPLGAARERLSQERRMAASWWRCLSKADREYLPHYDYRDLSPDDRILFTHRDFICEDARPNWPISCQLDFPSGSRLSRIKGCP